MNKITVKVSGISFAIENCPSLKNFNIALGGSVCLVKEPENAFDNRAIRVEYDGKKVGYIPRKQEGLDFSAQSWCHDYLNSIQANIEETWYKKDDTLIQIYQDGAELVGLSISLQTPHQTLSTNDDVFITKSSFSEPNIIVDFNETKHIYNMRVDGGYRTLKGGTTYIKRFYNPFDSEKISRQCAKYWGVSAENIKNMWDSNGNIAGLFGSVLHLALEHYINFRHIGHTITETRKKSGKDVNGNYAMPKHPFLKKTIESLNRLTNKLDKKYKVQEVVAEALVTDSATGWGGLIDRLAILDKEKKIARIQDYKVNIGAEKEEPHSKPKHPFSHLPANKLTKYALQLSFYASILKKHGWTIEGLDVYIYEHKWIHHTLELIDFTAYREEIQKMGNKD